MRGGAESEGLNTRVVRSVLPNGDKMDAGLDVFLSAWGTGVQVGQRRDDVL